MMRYWGGRHFRFKTDLLRELMDLYPHSKFKWLIVEVLRAALRATNANHLQLKSKRADVAYLQQNKPISKP